MPAQVSKCPTAKRRPKKSRKGRVLVARTSCTECNKSLAYSAVRPHMTSYHPQVCEGLFYVCREEGCELSFVSQARRYKHLIKDHGHRPKKKKRIVTECTGFAPPFFSMKETRYWHDCRSTLKNRREFLRHKKTCTPLPQSPQSGAAAESAAQHLRDCSGDEASDVSMGQGAVESPVIQTQRHQAKPRSHPGIKVCSFVKCVIDPVIFSLP